MFLKLTFLLFSFAFAQVEPVDGLRENPPSVWALTGARVYTRPDLALDNAVVLIRDGLIENVGLSLNIPADAEIIDITGKTIYPGFIESWLEIPGAKVKGNNHAAHWSKKVKARRNIIEDYMPNDKKLAVLHKTGFTVAHIVSDSGIFRGQSGLVQLNREGTVLESALAQDIAFETAGWHKKVYPGALLGVIALIRQTMIDGKWYGEALKKVAEYPNENEPLKLNRDLAVLGDWLNFGKPFIFQNGHELSTLRSQVLAHEFSLSYWLKGSGYEYRRIAEISKNQPFIILPLDFPEKPEVSDPWQALEYSTSELKHWDMAPDNPIILNEHKIPFALTAHKLKGDKFRKNLQRSVLRGLSESAALAALTTIPAEKMSADNRLGKIEKGYIANLTIVDGDYFTDKGEVIAVWVGGVEYPVKPKYDIDISGKWKLTTTDENYLLKIEKKYQRYSVKISLDTTKLNVKNFKIVGRSINWQVSFDSTSAPQRFSGQILNDKMEGSIDPSNEKWTAVKTGDITKEDKKDKAEKRSDLTVLFPDGAYGLEDSRQESQMILLKNATIWTSSPDGVLTGQDLLVKKGKFAKIGKNLKPPKNSVVIDVKGRHITAGLIDCHSHSAAFSINEGTQSITAEVRIQDVINSDDIAIYRELAGGLTTANILHGSANTIGGQNAVVKLRWGVPPDELLFEEAPKGIKFALGENVKQSNWGDDYTSRYPQTRMGVEQILRDAFTTASEYQADWADFKKNGKKWKKRVPPRRDLELEALVEIMAGERLVHCHSYRQDEILMLTRVAEDFGFTIGTFQHVLEGYKVADRLAEHGAGASTFSDWWAYKFEVIDAIPYNGALMTNVGVNVSFNSDSNELARRMNTEAAKGIKYGGLSEEEALNLVTINPAKQLGIDKWVGSIEKGKDADFVIWSAHPLSTNAVCEQTWIEGIQYFSLESDQKLRKRDRAVREQLIEKILQVKDDDKNGKWNHREKRSAEVHECLGR